MRQCKTNTIKFMHLFALQSLDKKSINLDSQPIFYLIKPLLDFSSSNHLCQLNPMKLINHTMHEKAPF